MNVGKASLFTVADNVEHFLWIDFRYLGNQRLSEDKEKCPMTEDCLWHENINATILTSTFLGRFEKF